MAWACITHECGVQELLDRGANPMGSKWELTEALRELMEAERAQAMQQLSAQCALPLVLSAECMKRFSCSVRRSRGCMRCCKLSLGRQRAVAPGRSSCCQQAGLAESGRVHADRCSWCKPCQSATC